ncbi:hypothetical protein [Winogradskya humida]|uniref:Uncharacterized protein n=1 Tax=Winogradskya humida TaxID=113566 RepID=A0ABQ4A538_9ACTN|nr:hypothetical protein [Actinoplanes humidus]GIE25956.1 hypothetical protein Ahu01nite_090580 [Actinoplanes humidus]
MPDRDPEVKQHTRLLTGLIWVGIGLAPIAAIVVLIGGSTGAMRFAVLLVAVCVVLIGAAMLIRTDPVLHRMDVEDRVSAEVDALRGGLRDELTATARATNNRVQALEDEMGTMRSVPGPAVAPRPAAGSARPAPPQPRISAPIPAPISAAGAASVPGPAPVPAQRGAGSARVGSASVAVPGGAPDKPAPPRISAPIDPSLHGGPGAPRSGAPRASAPANAPRPGAATSTPRSGAPTGAPRSGAATSAPRSGAPQSGAVANRTGRARPDGPRQGRAVPASVSPQPYDSYEQQDPAAGYEAPKGAVRASAVASVDPPMDELGPLPAPEPEAPVAAPRRRHAAPDTSTDLAREAYAEPSLGYGLTTGAVTPQPGVYGSTASRNSTPGPDTYDEGYQQDGTYQVGDAYQAEDGYRQGGAYQAGSAYRADGAYQSGDVHQSGDAEEQDSAYQSGSSYRQASGYEPADSYGPDNSYENDGYAQAGYDNTGYAQDNYGNSDYGQKGYDQAAQHGSAQAAQHGSAQAGQYGSAQAGQYGSAQAGQKASPQAGHYGSPRTVQDDYEQAEQTGYEHVEQAGYADAGYDQPGYVKQGSTYGASSGYTDTGEAHAADNGDADSDYQDSGYHDSGYQEIDYGREEAGYGTTYGTPAPATYGRSTTAPETPSSYDSSDFVSAGSYGYGGPTGVGYERDDDHHHYAPDPIPARNVYQSR